MRLEKKHSYLGRLKNSNQGRKAASNFESWKMKGFQPNQESYTLLIGAQLNSGETVLAFKYIQQWVTNYKNELDKSELNNHLQELANQCKRTKEDEILRKITKLAGQLKIKKYQLPKVRRKSVPRKKKANYQKRF